MTRTALAGVAARLALPRSSKWVTPEDYHLTLAFLGEVADERLPVLLEIGRALRAACCTIKFDATEFWAKPRVVVAAAQKIPPALHQLWRRLHADIDERLGGRTANPELALRAHVTLARKVSQAPVMQAMSPLEWRASSFSLIQSEIGGKHSAYTVVDTWPLLDET
jgi:RNA 2',3'-cyclic 3'-phosphodiesterase